MVAFDNTILSILLFPDAVVNEGPDGAPVERAQDRVNALLQKIQDAGEQGAHSSTSPGRSACHPRLRYR